MMEYLKQFYELHGRTPVTSDFRRGILPDVGLYNKKFGGLNKARMAAGIPVTIPVNGRYYIEAKIAERKK